MKIRSIKTGKIVEIAEGALYPKKAYEIVKDDEIKVGEPKVEVEVEETKEAEEVAEESPAAEDPEEGVAISKKETVEEMPKTSTKKPETKKTAKGVKKDDGNK